MKQLERRLQQLEEAVPAALPPTTIIVFYDSMTGQPSAPIPVTATTIVWMPDNGREENDNG